MESGERECVVDSTRARSRLARWGAPLAALLCAALAAGCDDEAPARGPKDRGDIVLSWDAPPDAASKALAQSIRETGLFDELAAAFNGTLKFPRDLPVTHEACGEENAFYDPRSGSLSMCYELLTGIARTAVDDTADEEVIGERVVGTWMFVFFHELGHALIDMYELPITGREEDAVDDFSALLLIELGQSDFAIRAAEYWVKTDVGVQNELVFADEHSLNMQRVFSILCLVYGSDPQGYAALVTRGVLPESRAVRCPAEYAQKRSAWDTLLARWEK